MKVARAVEALIALSLGELEGVSSVLDAGVYTSRASGSSSAFMKEVIKEVEVLMAPFYRELEAMGEAVDDFEMREWMARRRWLMKMREGRRLGIVEGGGA